MSGMYYGMVFCRSYGGEGMGTACADFADPNHPGTFSGELGEIHPRSGQRNIGGNCCSNITFVESLAPPPAPDLEKPSGSWGLSGN